MKSLPAPWRISYLKDEAGRVQSRGCVFCKATKKGEGTDSLVLKMGQHAFVVMNKYPYANGHLMVIPHRHTSDYSKLTAAEHQEMGLLLSFCVRILKKYGRCDGFNIGMNLGLAGGAGIQDHLHYHVVPRWNGDHNFMPVTAQTRVIPESIETTYEQLYKLFSKLK